MINLSIKIIVIINLKFYVLIFNNLDYKDLLIFIKKTFIKLYFKIK